MTFEREILALYNRGGDIGGRCLQPGTATALDGDAVTVDLLWQNGTCGAPSSARHPFILASIARTASDGSQWIQPTRSVCGFNPPSADLRACAMLGSGAAASPTASPAPAAAPTSSPTPSPAATPTVRPTPVATATPTATAPPTIARTPTPPPSPVAVASPPPAPPEPGPNYLLIGVIVVIVVLLGGSYILARPPRRG